MSDVTAATSAWNAIAAGGVGFVMFCLVLVLYKGLLVTRPHCDDLRTAEREKTDLLRGELERREGLYLASLTEVRGALLQERGAREKLQAQLDENNRAMYRFVDVIAEMKDAIKVDKQR